MSTSGGARPIWSGSDFPYMCLKDERRTAAFRAAMERTVRPGDTVVDVGAGSGILALFAASAGASRVHAVEIDHSLATALRETVALNGLDDVVTVVEGDALDAALPRGVVVAKIIDTGLLDELQVPALAHAGQGWAPTTILPVSDRVELAAHDFTAGTIDEAVAATRVLAVEPGRRANALRLSGAITRAWSRGAPCSPRPCPSPSARAWRGSAS
jgi:hypothetical protein